MISGLKYPGRGRRRDDEGNDISTGRRMHQVPRVEGALPNTDLTQGAVDLDQEANGRWGGVIIREIYLYPRSHITSFPAYRCPCCQLTEPRPRLRRALRPMDAGFMSCATNDGHVERYVASRDRRSPFDECHHCLPCIHYLSAADMH